MSNTGYKKIGMNNDLMRMVRKDGTTLNISTIRVAPRAALCTLLAAREKEWGIEYPDKVDSSATLGYLIEKGIQYKGIDASIVTVNDSETATDFTHNGYELFSATPVYEDGSTKIYYTLKK
jgi:hypothetical protein